MSTNNTILGIIAGTALGAAFGILYAPAKGSKTRDKIKTKTLEAKDELSFQANKLTEEFTSKFKSEKVKFENELDGLVTDMTGKADDVIVSLEKKLEDLKKRNSKITSN